MKILAYLFLIISFTGNGQELYRISQYSTNSVLFSSSLSSFNDGLKITALGRKQWSNISGSPTTGLVSISSNINSSKLSVSGFLLADEYSIFNRTVASVGLSYKLKINEVNYISAGINGGFNSDKVDLTRANYDVNDAVAVTGLINKVNPLFGFSLAYANTKLDLTASIGVQDVLYKRNPILYVSKLFRLDDSFDLHSSLLFKNSLNTDRSQFDVNSLLMYKKTMGAGIGYRLNNELVFMARLNLLGKYELGYAYDMSIGKLRGFNGHELYLRFNLKTKNTSSMFGTGYTNPLI